MTARDVLARALFYEFTADPADDSPPSWHVIAEATRDGWRRVADFVARMGGEKFDEPIPTLYVNHPRTEPADRDVIRDGEGVIRHCDAYGWAGKPTWWGFGAVDAQRWTHTTMPPQPLTLLVDGETAQVVP